MNKVIGMMTYFITNEIIMSAYWVPTEQGFKIKWVFSTADILQAQINNII